MALSGRTVRILILGAVIVCLFALFFVLIFSSEEGTPGRTALLVCYPFFLATVAVCAVKFERALEQGREYTSANYRCNGIAQALVAGLAVAGWLLLQFLLPQEHRFLGLAAFFVLLGFSCICGALVLWFKGTRSASLKIGIAGLTNCALGLFLAWFYLGLHSG